jgi:hypothetical protein
VLAVARRLQPSRRVVVLAWLVALLVHVPALPFRLVGWLDLLLDRAPAVDDEPIEGESFIPIELDLEGLEPPGDPGGEPGARVAVPSVTEGDVVDEAPVASSPPPPPSSAPRPPPPPPPPGPPPTASGDAPRDAGAQDASDDPYADDAGPPDAGPADAGPADAGPPDAGPLDEPPDAGAAPDGGPPPVASVGPDAGPARPLADPDDVTKVTKGLTAAPNVQVLLVGKALRAHPVGKDLGKLLAAIPQWRGFFAGTGIDPVADLEHMQITGPELRNSANVVSILEFSASGEAIRAAVDVVVKRTKGEWLTGKAFPTARARADRAERLFVILPSRRTLAVLPGKDEAKIDDLARLPSYPADLPFAIQISMVTPHRAFRSIDAIRIPESIVKMRLRAYGHGPGGARLELEFLDASPAKAVEDAAVMTEQWGKVQAAAMLGMLFLDDMPFRAEGARIVGATTFTREQLERILALATKSFTGGTARSGPRAR